MSGDRSGQELRQGVAPAVRYSAMRDSGESLRQLLENAHDCILSIDLEGRITYVNPAVQALSNGRDLIGLPIRKLVAPEFRPAYDEMIAQRRAGVADSFNYAFRMKDARGLERFFDVRSSILREDESPTGVLIIARDVTESKRAEAALKESETMYRSLVENAGEAIFIAQDGVLPYVNPKALELTAASAEELAVTPFTEVIHPEDRQFVLENHLRRLRGEFFAPRYRFRIIRKTGETRWVELDAVRIQWRGRDATLNFAADVTDWVGAEDQLRQTLQNLRTAVGSIIKTLSVAVETKDPYTAGHQRRVSQLCRAIAVAMGLPPDQVEGVAMAAMIHDIGKIGLPAEILSKPTRLTPIEFSLLQTHAHTGYDILKDIEFPWPVAHIVAQHHERMDGSGYPEGLAGEDILLEARILAVADVVEAMASYRPYRPAVGIVSALEEIERRRGVLYDSEVAQVCLRLFREQGYRLE